MRPKLLLLLPLLLATAQAAYNCPAATCHPPACQCASTAAPLAPASTVPQFLVLTNDDAVTVITAPAVRAVLDRFRNRNGCPLPCTWFVSIQYSQPEYIQQAYMSGHEIATHTMTHAGLPNASEIVGARTWLNQEALIPLNKIRGYRAPFLLHDPAQRKVLADAGFTYDSSITASWGGSGGALPTDAAHQLWPFTMDYGVPLDCEVSGTGPCSLTESHKGLWEFPLWNIQDDGGPVLASMDPVAAEGQPDITDMYLRELRRVYGSNRRPLGLYLHAARLLDPVVAAQYAAFFEEALKLPDVWVVTISEVLRWMADPVPAGQYSLDCPTPTDIAFPGGRFCMPPAGGCVQGTWSAVDCACRCINQGKPALSGFCTDANGACTIAKAYDFSTLAFYCAGQEAAPAAPAASPSPVPASPAATTAPASTGPGTTSSGTSPQPATPGTTVSSDSLSAGRKQSPAQPEPTATSPEVTSEPADPIASVLPLDGVPFDLTVAGELLSFMAATDNGEHVCDIVAALAGEAPSACTVAAIAETAAPAADAAGSRPPAGRRLASTGYLRISLALRPTARTQEQIVAALAAMQANGSLAIELAAAHVQLVGGSLRVLNAAPAHSIVAGAVAGAVGGAASLALAATVAFVVQRARLRKRAKTSGSHRSDALPTTVQDAASAKPSLPAKGLRLTVAAAPTRAGEAPVAAYSSSTSRGATPRHVAFSPTSGGPAGPSRFGPGSGGAGEDGVQPGSARADVVRGSEAIQMFN